MDKQIIIAIGREYGSAGHNIAKKLAETLGIKYYDKNLMQQILKEKDIVNPELEKFDESPRNLFFSRKVNGFSNSIADVVNEMQADYIKELAEKGESFVIVGRCADYVLAGNPALVSVFITGDLEAKLETTMEKENLTKAQAEAELKKQDKTRKAYYESHCDKIWGASASYDLSINSSKVGIEKAVEIILSYVDAAI